MLEVKCDKFDEAAEAGLSPILYHYTVLRSAANILVVLGFG